MRTRSSDTGLRKRTVRTVPRPVVAALSAVLCLPFSAAAQADAVLASEFFESRVRPVLANNCYACHSESGTSGLRVDSRQDLLKGGNNGPAIVPGDPDGSLLIRAVAHTHSRLKMPPGKKLSDPEIADLKAWIKAGAPWPETPVATVPPRTTDRQITAGDRAFWSFQPLQSPAIPAVKDNHWPKSTIDNFILARLEQRGLGPVRPAGKRVLIRRASFDLTGLPPTPQEIDAFLNDSSADAFARLVDRLLASPHFGERWGRYWLDIARYGEDDIRGLSRESYPNAWRYRDWVVQAFNADMPYDLFVKAQIAGDLVSPNREDLIAGLGYFGLGPWYYDITVPPQARADERHDRVDALTRGFLGLTVACARCHDHKFDPISTKDYYALAGVFASSEYRQYPLAPTEVVKDYEDRGARIHDKEQEIDSYTKSLADMLEQILAQKTSRYLAAAWNVMGPAKADAAKQAASDGLERSVLDRWVRYLGRTEREYPYLNQWDELLKEKLDTDTTRAAVARLAAAFQHQALSVLEEKKGIDEENHIALAQHAPKKKSMTRLPNGFATYDEFCPGCDVTVKALERDKYFLWRDLFSPGKPENGKPSAVLRFEGKDLEPWLSGEWKSHLDSLQAELKQMKDSLPEQYPYLHGLGDSPQPENLRVNLRGSPYNLGDVAPRRFLAVLSTDAAPFQQGSGRLELADAIVRHPLAARVMANRIWERLFGAGIVGTPSNFGKTGQRPTHPELLEYLAGRLIANQFSIKSLIREIMLSSAYQLSSEYSEINFAQDPDNKLHWRMSRRRLEAEPLRDAILFVSGSLDPRIGGPSVDLATDTSRRTIYGRVSRFKLDRMLALFDFPSPAASSEKRTVTNVPLQRLFYFNSDLVWSQAGLLAKRAQSLGASDAGRIAGLYPMLFGRPANDDEIRLGLEFLARSPWNEYVQVLLSSNEFSFVD